VPLQSNPISDLKQEEPEEFSEDSFGNP